MRRSQDFRLQRVGGQDLLVPLGPRVKDANALIVLNAAGRQVWELLAEDRTAEELAAALARRFEADPARVLADVRSFLDDLGRKGLLEP
ncbi:MAG TPA: PqqD family protein [Candidatus Aminicenantes bacterium]|nr:PqqD family protein [Candidatus Aminicenantes bacterium]